MTARTFGWDPEALENRDKARARAEGRYLRHRWSGAADIDGEPVHCIRLGCRWEMALELVDRNRSIEDEGFKQEWWFRWAGGVWQRLHRGVRRPPCGRSTW